MVQRIAVVTGSNKGIGFALVKGLCERFNGEVYLTSRDEKRGKDAVKELNLLGYFPRYHQLDVTDKTSIKRFYDYIKTRYGGLDILINNAAIAYPKDSVESLIVQAEQTISINYHSLVLTCEILFPLLRPHGRVINLTSALGHLSVIPGENIKNKFADKSLTEFKLNKLVNEFVKSVRRETNVEDGWGSNCYAVSKVAVTALTFIHSKMYGPKGISVNCYHPGYVNTDMTKNTGPMTLEQGAETGLYLALQAPQNLKGQLLWYDNIIVSWLGPMPNELYTTSTPVIAMPADFDDTNQDVPPAIPSSPIPGQIPVANFPPPDFPISVEVDDSSSQKPMDNSLLNFPTSSEVFEEEQVSEIQPMVNSLIGIQTTPQNGDQSPPEVVHLIKKETKEISNGDLQPPVPGDAILIEDNAEDQSSEQMINSLIDSSIGAQNDPGNNADFTNDLSPFKNMTKEMRNGDVLPPPGESI